MHGRLFAFDLDGTLLDHELTVTPRTLDALGELHRRGAHVVLASGRPWHLCEMVADQCGGFATHGVMANGAVLVDYGPTGGTAGRPPTTVLERLGSPRERIVELVRELRRDDPRLGFALSIDETFVFEPGFMVRMDGNPMGDRIDDVCDVTGETAIKLWAFHDELGEAALLESMATRYAGRLVVANTGLDAVEVGFTTIDKGTGLARLAELLGVDAADAVAFGDNLNDHAMLRWAGHAVAMGNADDATKALADEIAPPHGDDGVAVVLERLLGEW